MDRSVFESREVFVGRQPILDRGEKIFGYELLFRSKGGLLANVSDDIQATAEVMINTMSNIGVKRLIGEKKGFVNVEATLLGSGIIELFPKDSTVLEILETVAVTRELVAICNTLKGNGYQLALDDFIYQESYEPLFDLVTYVKIDILQYSRSGLEEICSRLSKKKIILLAEKVETKDDFDFCLGLGFELFQGYFFAKPSVIAAHSISSKQLALMELYKSLANEEEIFKIVHLFRNNPELNVKLLNFMNSASFFTFQKINSISQAVALLGYRNLQKWVTLLLYAGEGYDFKSSPLLERAAIRGRVMELLAAKMTGDPYLADSAYITGIFSLVDVLFKVPMKQILANFHLAEEINNALIGRDGVLGKLIQAMEKLEREEFTSLGELLQPWGLSLDELFRLEEDSIIDYENYSKEG